MVPTDSTHPERFSALFDLFVSLRTGYVRQSTIKNTFLPTRKAVVQLMHDPVAKDVTSVDLLKFIQQLLEKRRATGVNVNIRVLRAFGRWSAAQEILPEGNPFARLKTLRVADKPIRFLTREEFRRIFNKEANAEMRRIYFWGLMTGLRVSDLLRLQADDVHLDSRSAALSGHLRVTNSKSGRVTMLPLHPDLLRLLPEMPRGRDGSLWSHKYSVSYVSHRFKRAARSAEVKDVTFHTLRKTFGSWLAKNGTDVFEIQKLMMHSSPLLTAKYYASLIPAELGRYVSRLSAATGSVPLRPEEDPYDSGAALDYVTSTKLHQRHDP